MFTKIHASKVISKLEIYNILSFFTVVKSRYLLLLCFQGASLRQVLLVRRVAFCGLWRMKQGVMLLTAAINTKFIEQIQSFNK